MNSNIAKNWKNNKEKNIIMLNYLFLNGKYRINCLMAG